MPKFLFTTLPSNDLGLLTRSLPIAEELKKYGHEIIFSSPAKAPGQLIKDAGFENLVPDHPFYQLQGTGLPSVISMLSTVRRKKGILSSIKSLIKLLWAFPRKLIHCRLLYSADCKIKPK